MYKDDSLSKSYQIMGGREEERGEGPTRLTYFLLKVRILGYQWD